MSYYDLIKEINKKKIEECSKINTENAKKELEIYKKIENLFEENKLLFFEIPMEEALKLLSKLIDEKDLKETYMNLIGPDEYKELVDKK